MPLPRNQPLVSAVVLRDARPVVASRASRAGRLRSGSITIRTGREARRGRRAGPPPRVMTKRARLCRLFGLTAAACAALALLSALRAAAPGSGDPDALFRDREDLGLAAQAAKIWAARLETNPADYDAACKLARAEHWIGERLARDRTRHFKAGMAAARQAIAAGPERADGYFWLGANLGSHAGAGGILAALRYLKPTRQAFETSVRIDPRFNKGTAWCLLGKYYEAVPGLFGGSKTKAEAMLRRCLAVDPDSIPGHYYLAETLLGLKRADEAREALLAAIAAPVDPDFGPEARVWKRKAARLLQELEGPADRAAAAGRRPE